MNNGSLCRDLSNIRNWYVAGGTITLSDDYDYGYLPAGKYRITCSGAAGGTSNKGILGGYGGMIAATYSFEKTTYILGYPGKKGGCSQAQNGSIAGGKGVGNGGGGTNGDTSTTTTRRTTSGGGASGVVLIDGSTADTSLRYSLRLIVAGGGGGANETTTDTNLHGKDKYGYGGYPKGGDGAGSSNRIGKGGTLTGPGAARTDHNYDTVDFPGVLGDGGGSTGTYKYITGGGGGWYGGGCGGPDGGGGGGSSFAIDPQNFLRREQTFAGYTIPLANTNNYGLPMKFGNVINPSCGIKMIGDFTWQNGMNSGNGAVRIEVLEIYGTDIYQKANDEWQQIHIHS